MVTSIIFSKNRPLQLDLCLQSLKQNFLDCNEIFLLHKYEDIYLSSIEQIGKENKDLLVVQQSKSIYQDLFLMINSCNNNYICFFTDDDIFYKPFITKDYNKIFDKTNNVCTLSLRLGFNIRKRSHQGQEQEDIPYKNQKVGEFFIVPKTFYPYGSYWSYSHSVDGHIFRKNDLLRIMEELSYLDEKFQFKQTPNELETQMQRYWALSENNIVCPLESVVVNSPNNRVSNTHINNTSGEIFNYNPEYLLGLFLSGKRVNLNMLNLNNIECPHQEIDIIQGI